ncbi:MAG: dTDP-glucose 4,6-dehydratase [Termitinemataceae bacterium]|nr:MAG: dTDP-glucose 4,6-dehydratase [Termitinemataceae bacterium]
MRKLNNILITGGCGFIGCNFIRTLLKKTPLFSGRIINLDALTYAGNAESLKDIYDEYGGKRYFFEHGNICNADFVESIFKKYDIDTVVHFAAESHVDRSILGPKDFIETNLIGTFTLLEVARNVWSRKDGTIRDDVLFHHISTDEVYGSLGESGYFTEDTAYDPRSPYSASKAGSDHLLMAYSHTYGLPVTLSNCSNNYGPYQFPEKLIPLMILNILEGKNLPVYGDGKNIRDWIYVEDHNRAVWQIMQSGNTGEKYNIGGENEWENIKLLNVLLDIVCKKANLDKEKVRLTITYIKDRPGHDRRYAIDCSKIKKELNWKKEFTFDEGLEKTVDWYLANTAWIESIKSGEYKNWINANYEKR